MGLVAEHFFEMWDTPGSVHRVAVKTSADMIADSAAGHFVQGVPCHLQSRLAFWRRRGGRVQPQKKVKYAGSRELFPCSKAAPFRIVVADEFFVRGAQDVF